MNKSQLIVMNLVLLFLLGTHACALIFCINLWADCSHELFAEEAVAEESIKAGWIPTASNGFVEKVEGVSGLTIEKYYLTSEAALHNLYERCESKKIDIIATNYKDSGNYYIWLYYKMEPDGSISDGEPAITILPSDTEYA